MKPFARKLSRYALPLTLIVVALLPGSALAATVSSTATNITFTGGGENNLVTITSAGLGLYTVADGGGTNITPSGGCFGVGTSVTCSAGSLSSITVTLGDGTDSLDTHTLAVATSIDGGADDDGPFRTGTAADVFVGGGGTDEVSYLDRSAAQPVDADPDNSQSGDDGQVGEGDDIRNDVENLTGGTGNDVLTGNGSDNVLDGRGGNDTLSGGGGTDTASYQNSPAVTADLSAGTATGDGADVLAAIENLTGSANGDTLVGDGNANALSGLGASDTLTGNNGNDTLLGGDGNDSGGPAGLFGGGGADSLDGGNGDDLVNGGADSDSQVNGGANNDTLIGGAGDETLDGGTGTNTASYAGSTADITANLVTGSASGEGADTLTNFQNLTGGTGNDTLVSDGNANVLDGGADGSDTASFAPGAAVTANLSTGTATGQGSDTLANIDNLIGSANGDTLVSDANSNALDGGAGTDTASFAANGSGVTASLPAGTATGDGSDTLTNVESLTGGTGNDTLISDDGDNLLTGGNGSDTASFAAATGPVVASTTSATGDAATSDTLAGIENLTGGGFDDSLTGDGNANVLKGGAANDTLNGGGGNDDLQGEGGSGDTASFAGGAAVTADLRAGAASGQGSDTLGGVENLTGSSNSDTLISDANANVLDGGAGGTDTASYAGTTGNVDANLATGTAAVGGEGSDTLANIANATGGSGDDTLTSSSGNNNLNGGSGGEDTASFAAAAGGVVADLNSGTASGDGTDTLTNIDDLTGGSGADTLNGNSAANEVSGGDGADTLRGRAGDDLIDGQGDADPILSGGSDQDTVLGGGGADDLFGDDGNDVLHGNAGLDDLNGGNNADTASYDDAAAGVTASLQTGATSDDGDAASDTLSNLESLTGSGFADTLTGSSGVSNTLTGLAGDDRLNLRDGDADTSSAECGADTDTVETDAQGTDTINADCEKVDYPGEPDTAITAGPADGSTTNDATPTFSMTSTEPGSSFECKVDGDPFGACDSPFTTTTLADGSHTVQIRAVDPIAGDDASDVDSTPASRTFTVDATGPAAPTGLATTPTSPANDNTPEVSGNAEAGSTVKIYADAACSGAVAATGTAADFSSPGLTVSVPDDSSTTLYATATDGADNTSPCSSGVNYVEDSASPNTAITGGPTGTTSANAPTFTFTSTEPGTFQCSLDGGAFTACSSPYATGPLADGPHTLLVRAIDAAGNADPSPASRSFKVDSSAPKTRITKALTKTTDRTPTFKFGSTEPGSTFACSVDGGAFVPCSSPYTLPKLKRGRHTFEVRSTDSAGNVDQTPASDSFKVVVKRKKKR